MYPRRSPEMDTSDHRRHVILVLACGINPDGTVSPLARLRLEVGLQHYLDGYAETIIVSGRGPHYDPQGRGNQTVTEASAMRGYLIERGVPEAKILPEEQSVETVGNLYFSRLQYLEINSWYEPLIVTSAFHMPRVKLIADWVLGDTYRPRFAEAPDGEMPAESLAMRLNVEATLAEHFSRAVVPSAHRGDLAQICDALFRR